MSDANLFFFGGRDDRLVAGLTADIVPDTIIGKPIPSVIVGGRSREGKPARWASVIPSVLTERPMFNQRGKVTRGSIVDQMLTDGKTRKVIVSHKEGDNWYVLVRTGLRVGQEGMMGDLMDVLQKGDIKTHGSFSMDKGSGAFKVAEGRSERAEFGQAEAVRIWTSKGRKIPSLGMPNSEYSLWQVPVHGVVLVRDVTGNLTRLVGGQTTVQVVDAKGYDTFFDLLMEASLAAQKQVRQAMRMIDEDDAARR